MLTVNNISKIFGSNLALADLSFSVQPGELVGLLGRNGAGKSTCLRILSTYLSINSGTITLSGLAYSSKRRAVARLVGYVPDNPALYNQLTAFEYLEYIGKLRGLNGTPLSQAIDRVLADCQLTQIADVLCGFLSRGYRQRVSLAQALIHQPKLLLLDEPTIGLDPEQLTGLRQILVNTSKSSMVLFSSHMLAEVTDICSRVLIFENGQLKNDLQLDRSCSSDMLKVKLQAA